MKVLLVSPKENTPKGGIAVWTNLLKVYWGQYKKL